MIDRKNCQILVNLDFPQGWTYTIARMDYRGFYSLSAGATGTQQATYYFQGSAQQASLRTNFVGPTQGNYVFSDTLGLNALVWAPCGARVGVNINTSLLAQVSSPSAFAYLTTDSADGSVQAGIKIIQHNIERHMDALPGFTMHNPIDHAVIYPG